MEVEILSPESARESERLDARPPLAHVRFLGLFGTGLAVLTMLAAFGIGLFALFGTTIAAALIVKLLWPMIFSPEFTRFVFGSDQGLFWKLFLFFLASGLVVKLFRRFLGGR